MSDFDQSKIRRLDGGVLLVFRELLVRRQASAVARQLGLSPSSISHALARLRDVFDDPLFVRRSHGLEPTRRALELGPRIEALVEAIGQTVGEEAVFDPAVTRRRFRIACADPVESLIGPALVQAFRAEAPLATFTMRWAVLDRALRALRRGEADLAIGLFPEIPPAFEATPLYDDDYCVIARAGHPLVIDGQIDLAAYATAGHVFVGNPDGAYADETPVDREAMNATYGELPGPDLIRTHGYVSLWETAMLIVAATDVMADCPRRLAIRCAPRFGLEVLDRPFRPFRFTVQAVRRANAPDAGLDWLTAKLSEAVAA
ncbi:MAG TPA: LysR substrate-binding domain-containing protein [Caulobacteraceae bacterium]|nr:LysR substrate-binding domain-containing protein [Caulobacteraceae bacterium]